MIAAGIHPAMAGAAVFAGTWGAVWSPGSPHPAMIAKIANVSVIDVILAHKAGTIPAALLVAVLLFAEAKLFRQDRDWTPEKAGADRGPSGAARQAGPERVIILRALIPILPLVILLWTNVETTANATPWIPAKVSVFVTMVIGAGLGMLET